MPLTPEDVASKRFTPTRFKPGYDEEEVDAFLDEIEAELRRLIGENARLRDELAAARTATPAADTQAQEPPQEQALRTLLLAQRTADEAITQAKAEAEQILATARQQASLIEQEAAKQHAAAMADLQRQRSALEATIDGLRAFEREYRTRIKAYLEGQLKELEARTTIAPAGPAEPPDQRGTAAGHPGAGASPFTTAPPRLAPPAAGSPPPSAPPQPGSAGFATDVDAGSDVASQPAADPGTAASEWRRGESSPPDR